MNDLDHLRVRIIFKGKKIEKNQSKELKYELATQHWSIRINILEDP